MFYFTIEYHYENEESGYEELVCYIKDMFEGSHITLYKVEDISTDNDPAYDFIFKSTHSNEDELVDELVRLMELGSDDDRKILKQMIDEV